ncbi:MAG: DUF5803 family protein [Haloarculaceae archaeon]
MKRHGLALLGLLALVALAGCSSVFGPSQPDPAELAANATYDWNQSVNASITVNRSSFAAVYNVTNRSHLAVYRRDGLGRERSLPISALRYRYPNGTVVTVNDSSMSVDRTRSRTNVTLPGDGNGQVAFTAPRHGKEFSTPSFVAGSHAVTLPPDARVGIPLLSQVSPPGYETAVADDRMTIRWGDVGDRSISVRYYLERDLLLFALLAAGAIIVGSGGLLYHYRQLKRAQRRRSEAGLDIEEDDDPRDRGPPPGMR